MCTPIAALQAPGPRVTAQTPGRPRSLPGRLGHHRRTVLVPAGDDADAALQVVKRVEQAEELSPGTQ